LKNNILFIENCTIKLDMRNWLRMFRSTSHIQRKSINFGIVLSRSSCRYLCQSTIPQIEKTQLPLSEPLPVFSADDKENLLLQNFEPNFSDLKKIFFEDAGADTFRKILSIFPGISSIDAVRLFLCKIQTFFGAFRLNYF
jgi:hypothetical protein